MIAEVTSNIVFYEWDVFYIFDINIVFPYEIKVNDT